MRRRHRGEEPAAWASKPGYNSTGLRCERVASLTSMQQLFRYTVGEEMCVPSPYKRAREKRYAQSAMGVVLSGSFEYRAQNGAATAVPGTVILGNRAEYFRCHPKDGIGNRRQVVQFHQNFLNEVADSCGLTAARFHVAAIPPGRFSGAVFGAMRRLALNLALNKEDHEEAACELAEAALHANQSGMAPATVSTRNQQRVLSIVRHLERNYHEPWPLSSMANLARLSPCYFLRVFRMVTGQSPTQYLMYARLRAAANDLLTTRAPVSEIALRNGFNDISHFNASFRSVFGSSPTHWRLR
jgi:AraC family transcriptional regulator